MANLAEAVLYLMAVDQRSDGDAAKVAEILVTYLATGLVERPDTSLAPIRKAA